jgi:hypothetical protein
MSSKKRGTDDNLPILLSIIKRIEQKKPRIKRECILKMAKSINTMPAMTPYFTEIADLLNCKAMGRDSINNTI